MSYRIPSFLNDLTYLDMSLALILYLCSISTEDSLLAPEAKVSEAVWKQKAGLPAEQWSAVVWNLSMPHVNVLRPKMS